MQFIFNKLLHIALYLVKTVQERGRKLKAYRLIMSHGENLRISEHFLVLATSKIEALYSIFKIYGFIKGFQILKVYFIGGRVVLRDLILENRVTIGRVVWLSKLITKRIVQYQGDKIVIFVNRDLYGYPFPRIIIDENGFRDLTSLAMFKHYFELLKRFSKQWVFPCW